MEITPKHIINNEDISTDFVIDISEILIDSILEEGIFKEIPFIKSVVALYKTGKSIKNYYSVKKLYAFLIDCQGIDKNKFN